MGSSADDEDEPEPTLNENFLFFLLKEADQEVAMLFATLSLREFHDEMETLVANLRYPLETLQDEHLIEKQGNRMTLKLMQQCFAYLPSSIRC